MPKLKKKKALEAYDFTKEFTVIGSDNRAHKYDVHQDNLILWSSLDNSPDDRSSTSATLSYVDSPSTGVTTGFKFNYNFVTLNGSSQYVNISHNNNQNMGDASSDSPFSVSLWINRDSSPHLEGIFEKGTTTANRQYALMSTGAGSLIFKLYDVTNATFEASIRSTPDSQIVANTWIHVAITYDGRGGSSAASGLNIYINGVKDSNPTRSTHSSYVAMHAANTNLVLGHNSSFGSGFEFDGSLAEFSMWNKVLSTSNIEAIYLATSGVRYDAFMSGIVSNPPRFRLRQRDSATGSYPTTLRTGDKDRSGTYNTQFDDRNTLIFGRSFSDNFALLPEKKFIDIMSSNVYGDVNPDHLGTTTKNWSFSNGMEIRQEVTMRLRGGVRKTSALVFAGPGSQGERFITTRKPVRNPTLQMSLIQGPYNNLNNNKNEGLRLKRGTSTETLLVQISENGSTGWQTVKTFTPSSIGDIASMTNGGVTRPTQLPEGAVKLSSFTNLQRKASINVHMASKDFELKGKEFYIKIVQSSYSTQKSVWAIRDIELTSANQSISFPLGVPISGFIRDKIVNEIVATPNVAPEIHLTGSSISGISDENIRFTPGQGISSFNDNSFIEDPNDFFFEEGTNNDVLPGFSSKLSSKTKITVDLTPSAPLTFGNITKCSQSNATNSSIYKLYSDGDTFQKLMVYWNNVDKRWEPIGVGVGDNGRGDNQANNAPTGIKTIEKLVNSASNFTAGFAPIPIPIASGAMGTSAADSLSNARPVLSNAALLKAFGKPTDTFGFPFAGQYHATASQAITARDLGIHHPFVLEKCVLDYNAELEIPAQNSTPFAGSMFSLGFAYTFEGGSGFSRRDTLNSHDDNIKAIQPSFFILRQYNKRFVKEKQITLKRPIYDSGASPQRYFEVVSGSKMAFSGTFGPPLDIGPEFAGSPDQMPPKTSRDLITFGQTMFLLSSSHAVYMPQTLEELLDSGLSRDLDIPIGPSVYNSQNTFSLTGSYSMKFPCRTTPFIPDYISAYKMYLDDGTGDNNGDYDLNMGNSGGRGSGDISEGSRGLVNPKASFKKPNKPIFTPSFNTGGEGPFFQIEVPDVETIDVVSPYVILPDDKLIFGWQYPLAYDLGIAKPGTNATDFYSMTLLSGSKLSMYGSLVKNKVEHHTGLNQNLTSNAIHEIIGAEPIVDKFQISDRSEFMFTYNDRVSLAQDEGLFSRSVPANSLGASSVSLFISGSVSGSSPTGARGAFNRHTTHFDSIRFYEDSRLASGFFFTAGFCNSREGFTFRFDGTAHENVNILSGAWTISPYGTYQTNGVKIRPKYSFNLNHFGFASDMYSFGKDSKFIKPFASIAGVPDSSSTALDFAYESPVQIKFVSGAYVDDSNVRNFYLSDNPTQSLNKSTTATSSFGFYDSFGGTVGFSDPSDDPTDSGGSRTEHAVIVTNPFAFGPLTSDP